MDEQTGAVTFQGQPLTLIGPQLDVGDRAPDVKLLANDLAEASLSDFDGKVRIVSSVPSLDTDVCNAETRRFNQAAAGLGDDVVILTVSMDLPFAQGRWCAAAGVEAVKTLSDHREAAFGRAYGVLIKELRLLARVVMVVDREGTIRYVQRVKELTQEPDYEPILAAARELA
jgi:thiol peroxidase